MAQFAGLTTARTLATWLRDRGYYTGHVGKYLNLYGTNHDRDTPKDDPTYVPPGWDDWQALVDNSTYRMYDYTINDNGVLVDYGSAPADYQTDVLSMRAQEFIKWAAVSGRPFFWS